MKYQILSRYDSRVQFELECESLKDAVVAAVKSGANLYGADLRGANLYGANLREANLYGANLYGANLGEANLYGANLRAADLRGADLRGANLGEANLRGANLYGADLREANLYGANLRGANLYGANLYGADLGGANLYGANLYGANLGEKIGKLKAGGYFTCGPQGSRNGMLMALNSDNGMFVKAGCFTGSLEEFRAAVIKTHGKTSKHGKLYLGVANLIEYKFSEVIA
jgi:hypothetical protein